MGQHPHESLECSPGRRQEALPPLGANRSAHDRSVNSQPRRVLDWFHILELEVRSGRYIPQHHPWRHFRPRQLVEVILASPGTWCPLVE